MTSELIPAEFRGNLGFLVAKAKQLLSDELDVALRDSGLQIRHFAVLSLIRRRAGLRQTDLCEVLGVDRTTMVKVVDDLEGAGLLRREPHAADRRAHALHKRAAKLPTPVVYFVCTEVDKGVGEQVCYILDHGIYQRVRLG